MDRIEKIIEMLRVSENDSFLKHALALEYIKIGQLEEALAEFVQLLEFDPGYVGSYYHLGKLYEKMDQADHAILTYEKGMIEAKKIKDQHSYNELQAAKEELE